MKKNKAQFIGNIGQDTELRKTKSQKDVASTTIAVTEKFKKADGTLVESTDWFNLEFWGNTAINAHRLLKKGAGVLVEGSMRNEQFEGKDGKMKYITKMVVEDFMVTKYVTEKPVQGQGHTQTA